MAHLSDEKLQKLRILLAAVPGIGWTHGAQTGAIETSQADGVHGRTLFLPEPEEAPWRNLPAAEASIIAEAQLACAAVNALPKLLDEIDLLRTARDQAIEAHARLASNRCIECEGPLVHCQCRPGCWGGACPKCMPGSAAACSQRLSAEDQRALRDLREGLESFHDHVNADGVAVIDKLLGSSQ